MSQIIQDCIKSKQTTALTLLLPIMVGLIYEKWMWLMRYECECIDYMEWVESDKIVLSQNKRLHLPWCSQLCSIEFFLN